MCHCAYAYVISTPVLFHGSHMGHGRYLYLGFDEHIPFAVPKVQSLILNKFDADSTQASRYQSCSIDCWSFRHQCCP